MKKEQVKTRKRDDVDGRCDYCGKERKLRKDSSVGMELCSSCSEKIGKYTGHVEYWY